MNNSNSNAQPDVNTSFTDNSHKPSENISNSKAKPAIISEFHNGTSNSEPASSTENYPNIEDDNYPIAGHTKSSPAANAAAKKTSSDSQVSSHTVETVTCESSSNEIASHCVTETKAERISNILSEESTQIRSKTKISQQSVTTSSQSSSVSVGRIKQSTDETVHQYCSSTDIQKTPTHEPVVSSNSKTEDLPTLENVIVINTERDKNECHFNTQATRSPPISEGPPAKTSSSDSKERKQSRSVSEIVVTPRYANFLSTKCDLVSTTMEETVNKLKSGAQLWKVRGVGKYYNRRYKVDMDALSLVAESKKWWSPGKFTTGAEQTEYSVPLIDVEEIRSGWKTDTFNKVTDHIQKLREKGSPVPTDPPLVEDNCFSLILGCGGPKEILDLVAGSPEERDLWVSGLKHVVEGVQSLHQERQYDIWLRKKFESADEDKNGALTFDEICNLISSLNLKMNKKNAKILFNEANRSKRKRGGEQALDAQEFVSFYHSLEKMPEIELLYKKYANKETKVMALDDLTTFLQIQNHSYSENDINNIIQEFEYSSLKEEGYLSYDGFYHLLLSDYFNVYNSDHQKKIHQDMTQPLSNYYISSSHNTYLTGHQLAGESSVEGYISALKRGCRVVELDIWDGDDGEPIIYHGHTLTTKITLADVLRDAIKIYAFTASPYPVILSIENHLCLEQQGVMVKLLKEILGDMLHSDPAPADIKYLPSPEDLKHKILVKAKKPQGSEVEDDDEEDDADTDNIDYIDSDDGASQTKKSKHHKPLAPELRQVVNVCEGKKFVSLGSSIETDNCVHFPSLRENKAKALMESSPAEFVKFTSRQIAKVYPHGTRTDSSNLKPYPLWSVGAQVVTLNMQTEDKANFYNEALFRSNGNCGYVMKPDILLEPILYNPQNPPNELGRVLRVKVISGQHLPPSEKKNDIVDPYIQLKVRGHPLDKQKQKTKTLKNNGFNPVWNETLEVKIKVPPVSLIYFTVRDESSLAKDPVLALACIPFSSITTGYRHVHLTDLTGKSVSPAALFIHVSISL